VVLRSWTWDSFLSALAAARAKTLHVRQVQPELYDSHSKTSSLPRSHSVAMKRSGSGRVARKVGSYDDSAESAESSTNEVQKPTG
jgi:hypothetical protein